jgi:hypothetical protein
MTVHVYPLEDWIEHRTDQNATECDCPCEPEVEYVNPVTGEFYDEPLIIHNMVGEEMEMTVVLFHKHDDKPLIRPINWAKVSDFFVAIAVISLIIFLTALYTYEITKRF